MNLPFSWPTALMALRYPDFRRYFIGQAISILGSWVQRVALSWLVYRITGSASLLGLVSFVSLAPQLLIGPWAGAWIDQRDKRRSLIVVELLLTAHATLIALLTISGLATPVPILLMALAQGILSSFEGPLRLALISSFLSDPEALPSGLSLNAMLANGARFIGPPIAGFLLHWTNESTCFALNALSCLPLAWALTQVNSPALTAVTGRTRDVFMAGLHFARQTPRVMQPLLLLAILNLTGSSYGVLLPIVAHDLFQGGAHMLGMLWGAAGFGALAGTIVLAMHQGIETISQAVRRFAFLGAIALVGCAISHTQATIYASLVLLGFSVALCNAGVNILLQEISPTEFKGRIIALFYAIRFGLDAVGSLLAGFLAAVLGVSHTFMVEGVLLLLSALALRQLRKRGL